MPVELYKGRVPIIRRSLNDGFIRGTPDDVPSTGCVERDYDIDPVAMGDSPASMKLVEDSEIDAIFDEQEEQQSSLEHMYVRDGNPAFEFLDQNGFPDCHTADTEVLTDRGFVAWPDYNWTDPLGTVNQQTHALEYQMPFQKIVKPYDGPIVYSDNRRVDFGVTPGHGMYVRKWDERLRTLSPDYSFVKAGELGWYSGLLHAPSGQLGTEIVEVEVPGDRRYDGDDFFAMLGLIASDGYAGGTEKTRNLVSFASFRKDIRDNISALGRRIGFKEAPSREGVWNRWSAGALANWLRANCYTHPDLGARNKCVPAIVKCASIRQIKIFLHYFDDRNREGRQFYSTSKRLIDDLQELHLKIGMRSTIVPNHTPERVWDGKTFVASDGYRLIVSFGEQLCLDKKKHIVEDHYKGEVYCAAVPNHTLITRRNGKTLISSNCWAHSTAHALMVDRMKQGLPPVRFNAVAIATLLNQTNGGWCGLSMKFIREKGCPVIGDGPGEWPYHTRRNHDSAELRANMAKYKSLEDWYDLGRREWDQKLSQRQLRTLGCGNIPVPTDYNEYGHSMLMIRLVRIEKGHYGRLTLNSWKGFGYLGLCVIPETTANVSNAVALRVSSSTYK